MFFPDFAILIGPGKFQVLDLVMKLVVLLGQLVGLTLQPCLLLLGYLHLGAEVVDDAFRSWAHLEPSIRVERPVDRREQVHLAGAALEVVPLDGLDHVVYLLLVAVGLLLGHHELGLQLLDLVVLLADVNTLITHLLDKLLNSC